MRWQAGTPLRGQRGEALHFDLAVLGLGRATLESAACCGTTNDTVPLAPLQWPSHRCGIEAVRVLPCQHGGALCGQVCGLGVGKQEARGAACRRRWHGCGTLNAKPAGGCKKGEWQLRCNTRQMRHSPGCRPLTLAIALHCQPPASPAPAHALLYFRGRTTSPGVRP